MMLEPKCSKRNCRHWIETGKFIDPTGSGGEGTAPVCEAFPNGIPDEIAWGDNPHIKPYPGDHDIQYEKE